MLLQLIKKITTKPAQKLVLQQISKAVPLFPNLSQLHQQATLSLNAYYNFPSITSYYQMKLLHNKARLQNKIMPAAGVYITPQIFTQRKLQQMFKTSSHPLIHWFWNKIPRLLIIGGVILYFYSMLSIDFGESEEFKDVEFSSVWKSSNKSNLVDVKKMKLRFSDVIGIEEFKEELMEIVDYLKNPNKYKKVGAKLPRGILLEGPPGTGKTLLAKALAGEAGCNFIYKSGSDFDQIFVGVGAERVRKMFETAKKQTPCIIFIDEIDSIAGKRSKYLPGTYRAALNQLLTQMDGFSSSDNIIVIGATNLAGSLDSAVKRPGRFDRTISIPLPDVKGRQQILDYYKKKVKIDAKLSNSKSIAKLSVGFSGADLENLVNIAVLNAVKNQRKQANEGDFQYAFDRVKMGIGRKSLTQQVDELKKVAYHEAGHALICLLTSSNKNLHKITILPRGGAMGYTASIPKDQIHLSKKQIEANIEICLGGRAAEEIIYGDKEITTGCSSDLMTATHLAYSLVKEYGMQQDLTVMSHSGENRIMSDEFKYQIDTRAKEILDQAYERVFKMLQKNRKTLDKLVEGLMEHETLDRKQVKSLIGM